MSSEKETTQNHFLVVWFSGHHHHEAHSLSHEKNKNVMN